MSTYDNTIRPLRLAPNYKTNPLLCQSKFLQHCSPDAAIRAISEEAGKQFADFKTSSRMRSDVFKIVSEYAGSEEAKTLSDNDRHFVDALLRDFKKGGLALPEEERKELQKLLSQDTACCAKYKNNLGEDSTKLVFKRYHTSAKFSSFFLNSDSIRFMPFFILECLGLR